MPEEEEQKGEAAVAASAMPVSPLPWPESAVSPDMARFSANRAESEQRQRESAKKKKRHVAGRGRTSRQQRRSRVAVSGRVGRGYGSSGAASVLSILNFKFS